MHKLNRTDRNDSRNRRFNRHLRKCAEGKKSPVRYPGGRDQSSRRRTSRSEEWSKHNRLARKVAQWAIEVEFARTDAKKAEAREKLEAAKDRLSAYEDRLQADGNEYHWLD